MSDRIERIEARLAGMTEHNHAEFFMGCYRCELGKDELTPLEAGAEALFDWLPVPEHRDDATRAVLTNALDSAEPDIVNTLSKAWAGATVGDMVNEIRKIMLGEEG